MALTYSNTDFTIIEIDLKNKPTEMIAMSPKGTVPVLQTATGKVIDESLDIMYWALENSDPAQWMPKNDLEKKLNDQLIYKNDNHFKYFLDKFKYPNKYTQEAESLVPKQMVKNYLNNINKILNDKNFLIAERITITDIAIFPFVRQAINVNKIWFNTLSLDNLNRWFNYFSTSILFNQVMRKIP